MSPHLRLACMSDLPALHTLIEQSVLGLQHRDYTPKQLEGALGAVLGVDTQLVEDGTYFLAEWSGELAGCGGWSYRKTLFGGDGHTSREAALLDPAQHAARIRAFFVHPNFARRGIGTALLAACEAAACAAGFRSFAMGATLTGVPLYLARGYHITGRIDVPLPNGEVLPVVPMAKDAPKEVS